ncbi:MAG: helix-turn-helix transcriptional regulator [Spirochaetes bacterium]|nr:helix-turn-helix transcriptional regulator [Spirochaetota bacterium]
MHSGERLKLIFDELNLTQQEVADRFGINRSLFSMLFSGKQNISKLLLYALKSEFNVNPTWLLSGEGEMFLQKEPATVHEEQAEYIPKKINHLMAHKGNAKTFPQVDDIDKIANTGWWEKIGDTKQWIVAALDELSLPEHLNRLKAIAVAMLQGERADRELQQELKKLEDKILNESGGNLRKKGEAG